MSHLKLASENLESVINDHPDAGVAERAAAELGQMRDALAYLSHHLVEVKRQTDHSIACLQPLAAGRKTTMAGTRPAQAALISSRQAG